MLMFLLCLLSFLIRSKITPLVQLDFPNLLLLLLTGWVLLSVKNSQQSFDSFYSFKGFLALVLIWFSLRMIWDRWPELFPWFEKVFFWTAIIAASWLLVTTAGRWFWFDTFVRFIPRQGLFPNQNIAAGFLGMALVWMSLKWLHRDRPPLWGFFILLPAWGLTESRGSLVSLALVVILYLLIHMKEMEKRLSKWGLNQWVVFGGIVLLVVISSSLMVNRFLNAEERSYFRIDVWISSIKMAMAQPLFGFGPGTFADVYPFFRPVGLWNTFNPFAHNEFLQVAAECGLPAVILLFLLMGTLFQEFWGVLRKTPGFQEAKPFLAAGEVAFYIVLLETIHNMVDFTFHEWSHRLVLLGFLTYALRERKTEDDLKTIFHFSRRAFLIGVGMVVLFVGWILGVGAMRDYLVRTYDLNSILAQREGHWEEAEVFARQSLRYRSNFMDPWNSLGAIEDIRAGMATKPNEREKHFQLAEEYFGKAIQLSPFSLTPRENEIQEMVKRGRLEDAKDLQNQLIEKLPELPTNYSGLGLILMQMGRPQEALVAAQKVINLDPYFLPGHLLKGQALEAMGKSGEALRTYEDARDMLKSIGRPDPSGQIEPNIQKLKRRK